MNIRPKITLTLLLASALSIISTARLTAQTPPTQAPLWKVSKTELRNDDRQFVIVLERSVLEAGQPDNPQIRKIAAVIRNDNSLLTYLPVNGAPTEKITVDLANKSECASLTALISDFREVDASNKAKEAAHQVATGDEGKKVNSFSGTLGDFDVSYQTDIFPETGNGKYGGAITLVSKDGDSTKDRSIVEPTALEQAVLMADSFRQMQQAAIQSKAQQLASQKALQDEQTQDELAKAKADSDERVKKEAALRQQQLAEQEKQQKLQAIKDAEVADALVITNLQFFSESYTQAINLLSFDSITSERSLQRSLGTEKLLGRELHYPKSGITHYDAEVQKNDFAKYLEPIAKKYFGEIKPTDKRMMEHCYVFARGTKQIEDGIKTRLSDDLTSFFKKDGAQEISNIRTGGRLGDRIAQALQQSSVGEVLILYGGKGAGKSTFLKRLLYHDPPTPLQLYGYPIIVDCLRAPQGKDSLSKYLWEQITTALDQGSLLGGSMEQLIELFSDRFSIAEKQELAGYTVGSGEYVRERNKLVTSWKQDAVYVAKRLKEYWRKRGKKLVVAFDNTDQLPPPLQDHCFLLAQSISRELMCIGIISMREERYCRARTVGVLDAYQNAGFHLAAPDLVGVFTKRIHLVIADLKSTNHKNITDIIPVSAPFEKLQRFFISCLKQFRNEKNSLKRFLEECSRDNTRMALDFFAQFLSSGYTHVEEMVNNIYWTVIDHQVIKPMMIPQRYNYDENKSLIPNIYQCRTPVHGSHFTSVRILKILRSNTSSEVDQGGYLRADSLVDVFDSKYGMRHDCEAALDVLLRHGLVEANNRLDTYFVEKAGTDGKEYIYADEIRITAFGIYMLEFLSGTFTYLDLVSLDCGLADEKLYHEFCIAAANERNFGTASNKKRRLESRIQRTSSFVKYLQAEEAREKGEFLLSDPEDIMPSIKISFETDKERAITSAKKNISWENK